MGHWLRKGSRCIVSVSHGPFVPLRRAMLIICCVLVASQLLSFLIPQRVPTALAAPSLEGPAADPSGAAVCGYGHTRPLAEVQERMLTEASALVASQRQPGIYWTLNDSKNDPLLFAVDLQGRVRGRLRVSNADNVDWESLQVGPGRDGGAALYVGDTGDNKGKRREMVIYRVPEPESTDARGGATSTAPAEAFRFVYPGSPRNTEAMLVHPRTGEIVLITKEADGHSLVFRMPTPLDGRRTVTLEQVGAVNVSSLGSPSGLVTDASITPDARRVTVRTYTSALEYEVPDGAPLASIWGQSPRVIPLDDGAKGEGLTYRVDGGALISIGEGATTLLFETPREC
jgi:hypothetical protein